MAEERAIDVESLRVRAEAQFALGICYDKGDGVSEDKS